MTLTFWLVFIGMIYFIDLFFIALVFLLLCESSATSSRQYTDNKQITHMLFGYLFAALTLAFFKPKCKNCSISLWNQDLAPRQLFSHSLSQDMLIQHLHPFPYSLQGPRRYPILQCGTRLNVKPYPWQQFPYKREAALWGQGSQQFHTSFLTTMQRKMLGFSR